MKENKLTPEEIKKALECCGEIDDGCLHCPLLGSPVPECGIRVYRESLDLINRQQAEIERLQNDLAISRKETKRYATRRASECEDCAGCTQWNCDCANERAEALREVADRLDRKFAFCSDTQCISAKTIRKFIQDELKEMVGDDK